MANIDDVRTALRIRIEAQKLAQKRAQCEVLRELLELAKGRAVEALSAHSYSTLELASTVDARFFEGEAHALRNFAQLMQCKLDALEAEAKA